MTYRRIVADGQIAEGLDALVRLDPRLGDVRAAAGEVPLRLVAPGFGSLVSIVIGQQVSRASAKAIAARLFSIVEPCTPDRMLAAGEDAYRAAGLSRPKQRTLAALCRAVADGLDLEGLCLLEPAQAQARLTSVPGIGPWTAEVYLLTAAGHPDVFPARDVALQAAVADGLQLPGRPNHRQLAEMAESWAPWRSVAARLFWAYWAARAGRAALPI